MCDFGGISKPKNARVTCEPSSEHYSAPLVEKQGNLSQDGLFAVFAGGWSDTIEGLGSG